MDPRPPLGARHSYHCLPPRSSFRLRDRIVDYQLAEMAVLLRTGELTSEQLTIACLARLYELETHLNGYGDHSLSMHIDAQQALTRAKLADQWLSNADDPRGPAPLLCGIVLGIGESLATLARKGHPWRLENTPLVARLQDQGAVLLGPLRGSLQPGPQSALSAISPMIRLCAAALAETADEAFMISGAAHGASGIKPSLGLAIGWDIPGSVARSVRDASLVLTAISEHERMSTASTPLHWPMAARLGSAPLAGIAIGAPPAPASPGNAAGWQVCERFRQQLSGLGAQVLELPDPVMRPQDAWDASLLGHGLNIILVMSNVPAEHDWLPSAPGWPMVTFPIGHASSDGVSINAGFCGPHLTDATLIQAAVDFQAHYPQYHDAEVPRYCGASCSSATTAPRTAWPTG